MSSLETIELWHKRARPTPTQKDLDVQLGCHFEEIIEMLASLRFITPGDQEEDETVDGGRAISALSNLSLKLKHGHLETRIFSNNELLDSIADQVVTGIGVAHCADMNAPEAIVRVNSSNWSKFDHNGQPMFDDNGKIMKGPNYTPPDLEGLW